MGNPGRTPEELNPETAINHGPTLLSRFSYEQKTCACLIGNRNLTHLVR